MYTYSDANYSAKLAETPSKKTIVIQNKKNLSKIIFIAERLNPPQKADFFPNYEQNDIRVSVELRGQSSHTITQNINCCWDPCSEKGLVNGLDAAFEKARIGWDKNIQNAFNFYIARLQDVKKTETEWQKKNLMPYGFGLKNTFKDLCVKKTKTEWQKKNLMPYDFGLENTFKDLCVKKTKTEWQKKNLMPYGFELENTFRDLCVKKRG